MDAVSTAMRRYRIRLSDWLHRKAHDGAVSGRRSRRSRPRCPSTATLVRRTQVLLLCDRRNYDRSMAGLGTGKAQRYFASDGSSGATQK
jgi:hypothetical protein